jgi:hypothetical protein
MTQKQSKKHIAQAQQNPWVLLLKGFVFAGITYAIASWAIDSGAIPLYVATFVGAYMTIRAFVQIVKNITRN